MHVPDKLLRMISYSIKLSYIYVGLVKEWNCKMGKAFCHMGSQIWVNLWSTFISYKTFNRKLAIIASYRSNWSLTDDPKIRKHFKGIPFHSTAFRLLNLSRQECTAMIEILTGHSSFDHYTYALHLLKVCIL